MLSLQRVAAGLVIGLALGLPAFGQGTTFFAFTAAQLQSQANMLGPGDTLVVASSISISSLQLSGLSGTNTAWITIRGQSPGTSITGTSATQEVIRIENCNNLRLEDLTITSTGTGPNVNGIYMPPGTNSSNVIVDDCRIFGLPGTGILSEADLTDRLFVLNTEVAQVRTSGIVLGTGNQIGTATLCVIRDCWIHDVGSPLCSPAQPVGAVRGIEIRGGGSGNVIERNRIHEVCGNINAVGIATFWVDLAGTAAPADWNVIRQNMLWNVRDSDPNDGFYIAEYIFAVNGAIIENNVISDGANSGVNSSGVVISPINSLGANISNIFVRHNTVYGCARGIYLLGFNQSPPFPFAIPPVIIANNLCLADTTIVGSGLPNPYRAPTGLGMIPNSAFTGNAGFGGSFPASLAALVVPVGAPASEVVSPTNTVPGVDLYPLATASLRGVGDASQTLATDFNGTPRSGPVDCGAYHWTQAANPGPPIVPSFLPTRLSPTRTGISAAAGGSTLLTISSRAPAGSLYACGISLTGIAPLSPIPLIFDAVTLFPLDPLYGSLFVGYVGALTAGSATFQLNLPPIGAAGPLTLYHAAVVIDPTGALFESTNTARVIVQ